MFDFRYHAASLAAVFLALAVGVLLGVAISGKVSDTQSALNEAQLEDARSALALERERTGAAERRGETADELLTEAYPALMEDRLNGKSVALVFLGDVAGDVRSAVDETLAAAGAGAPVQTISLELPLDVDGLDDYLAADERLAAYSGGSDFADLGRALGEELIRGGETPLWSALSSRLVRERSRTTMPPVDGAVVVRSWSAGPADDVEEAERDRASETLVDGLIDGLDTAGFPVVGVETAATPEEESAIDLYRRRGISSVDHVDTLAGHVALAVLLAGGEPGHYGLDEAKDLTPPIEPVPAEADGG